MSRTPDPRAERFAEMRANGMSLAAIGRAHGLSRERVRVILQKLGPIAPPGRVTLAGRGFTAAEDDALRAAYATGASVTEIATKLGRSVWWIRARAAKLGIARPPGPALGWRAAPDPRAAEFAAAHAAGMSYETIGRAYGLTGQRVRRIVLRHAGG
jgi:hypothetical protein